MLIGIGRRNRAAQLPALLDRASDRADGGGGVFMLRVTIYQARDGMIVAMPVLHPRRPEVVLLRPGAVLDPHTIAKMREIGLHEVWVKYPRLDRLSEYFSAGVVQACAAVTGQIRTALDSAMRDAHARLDYAAYRRAVSGLLEKFCERPKAAMFVGELGDGASPALRHASSVCMLSVLMGIKLDFYLIQERIRLAAHSAKDVSNLGVGAMLHDIGMVRLDPAVRERWEATRDESDPEFREHVQIGFEMVRDQIEPSAAAVVLHHHQAFDGTGFPVRKEEDEKPPKGQEIHVFARIVAAADRFVRLQRTGSANGTAIPTVRALKLIQEPAIADKIDPVVLKALFNVVPAYAPGTIVTLSSGHECVVTHWSHENPCRPVVETLVPPGRDDEPEAFDLRLRSDISVVRAEGHAVAEDNFAPMNAHAYDLLHGAMGKENRTLELLKQRKAS
ncbi:MAG: HD domain-containing protein [Phycisphaeraceae bacterium]|nr:HD domain-containing protein [Phycisphaeraceae bacterium]